MIASGLGSRNGDGTGGRSPRSQTYRTALRALRQRPFQKPSHDDKSHGASRTRHMPSRTTGLWNMKGNGAPERIRTSDPQIRSLVLYPAELRAHVLLMDTEQATGQRPGQDLSGKSAPSTGRVPRAQGRQRGCWSRRQPISSTRANPDRCAPAPNALRLPIGDP